MKKKILLYVALALGALVVVFGFVYRGMITSLIRSHVLSPGADIGELIQDENNNTSTSTPTTSGPIALPEGVIISVFAKSLTQPRDILIDQFGNLLVSEMGAGRVSALSHTSGGEASKYIVVEKLSKPHGLALDCPENSTTCVLYVAEEKRISAYNYSVDGKAAIPLGTVTNLPSGGNHVTRSLHLVHVDDKRQLLVSIGSSCNVCREADERRGAVMLLNPEKGEMRMYARGLRNSVFLTTRPHTNEIWATDMGRDFLGDDLPPDEVNVLSDGGNYGWPNCYGKNVHDTQFDKNTYIRNPCMEPFEVPSKIDLPAHSAPLGLSFFPETGWPKGWAGDLLIAYHGSWNRSTPTGYKIVRVEMAADGTPGEIHDFATGWLKDGKLLGRPADIEFSPNGDLYVSDDKAGIIYRIFPTTEATR